MRRVISWLNGDPVAAAPVCSGKFAVTAVTTAAIGATTAVTPIAAVYASARLAAAPSVTAQPGNSVMGGPHSAAHERRRATTMPNRAGLAAASARFRG